MSDFTVSSHLEPHQVWEPQHDQHILPNNILFPYFSVAPICEDLSLSKTELFTRYIMLMIDTVEFYTEYSEIVIPTHKDVCDAIIKAIRLAQSGTPV